MIPIAIGIRPGLIEPTGSDESVNYSELFVPGNAIGEAYLNDSMIRSNQWRRNPTFNTGDDQRRVNPTPVKLVSDTATSSYYPGTNYPAGSGSSQWRAISELGRGQWRSNPMPMGVPSSRPLSSATTSSVPSTNVPGGSGGWTPTPVAGRFPWLTNPFSSVPSTNVPAGSGGWTPTPVAGYPVPSTATVTVGSSSSNPVPNAATACIDHVAEAYTKNDGKSNFLDSFENKTLNGMSRYHQDAIDYYNDLFNNKFFEITRGHASPLKSALLFCRLSTVKSKINTDGCFDVLEKIGIKRTWSGEEAFHYIYYNHDRNSLSLMTIFNLRHRITRRTAKGGSDYDILEDDGRENAMRFTIQFDLITDFVRYHKKAAESVADYSVKSIQDFCSPTTKEEKNEKRKELENIHSGASTRRQRH